MSKKFGMELAREILRMIIKKVGVSTLKLPTDMSSLSLDLDMIL